MPLSQAQAFINRMKSDRIFMAAILGASDTESRLEIAKIGGFTCNLDDIKSLYASAIEPDSKKTNFAISYQCKGPCHTKCAAVVT